MEQSSSRSLEVSVALINMAASVFLFFVAITGSLNEVVQYVLTGFLRNYGIMDAAAAFTISIVSLVFTFTRPKKDPVRTALLIAPFTILAFMLGLGYIIETFATITWSSIFLTVIDVNLSLVIGCALIGLLFVTVLRFKPGSKARKIMFLVCMIISIIPQWKQFIVVFYGFKWTNIAVYLLFLSGILTTVFLWTIDKPEPVKIPTPTTIQEAQQLRMENKISAEEYENIRKQLMDK